MTSTNITIIDAVWVSFARGFRLMSKLKIALCKRISQIVNTETRYFDFLDFVPEFIVDGQIYQISYGTFRNYMSKLARSEKVEVVAYSPQAFYSLKGVRFGNPMTRDHTGALIMQNRRNLSNDPVYRIIQNLPFGKRALHDIRLRFEVKRICDIFSSQYNKSPNSDDISLPRWTINDLEIMATVHSTDTVSVVIGCSFSPVAVDVNGVVRLSNALATTKERISNLANNSLSIPDHLSWIVTMWHFGADTTTTYTREKFYASWEVAQHALITVYSKDWKDGKSRVRIEKQEYPQKSLAEALEEKLYEAR
jgi:hypothetical protein